MDAGAVRPVRRQIDLDHRIVDPGVFRETLADRSIGGQIDNAVVIVGDLQLRFRHQHAAAFDAADGPDSERNILAGNVGARRHEHADHSSARVRRAAHDLDRFAVAGINHADAQPVCVRMLLGLDDSRDDVGRQQLALVFDALDLEPDHGELVGDLAERMVGTEMLLEPGQGEFHHGAIFPRSEPLSPPPLAGEGGEGAAACADRRSDYVHQTPSKFVITS